MKIIFATHNQGKVKEVKAILGDLGVEVLSAEEAGIFNDVVEDGQTFADNALKKARFVSGKSKQWALGDDSGICIEALGGKPGVYSARWAGDGASDDEIINYAVTQIKNIPKDKNNAYFETAVALVAPDGREWIFSGHVDGRVLSEAKGAPRHKLPYDVIFAPNGFDLTFAQMSDQQKNGLSHRGLALKKLKDFLLTQSF